MNVDEQTSKHPKSQSGQGDDSLDRKIAARPTSSVATTVHRSDNQSAVGVNETDVLCGRRRRSFNHPGNKRFREIITAAVDDCSNVETRLEKALFVQRIFEQIRETGGRFLKMDSCGQWREMDKRACIDKVGHAIRDAARTTNKQFKKRPSSGSTLTAGHSEQPQNTARQKSSYQHRPSPCAHHGQTTSQKSAGEEADHYDDPEDSFERHIDEVLGPLPPHHDVEDPLADFLDES